MSHRLAAMNSTVSEVVCDVPSFHSVEQPLSPWLRLVHRRKQAVGPKEVPLRHLLDFELLLVLEGTPWLWVEPAGGAIRLRSGSLAMIPPGLVHTWGDTADTHLAVHFDLCAQPDLAPLKNMIVRDRWVTYRPPHFEPRIRWIGFGHVTTPLVHHLDDLDPWRQWLEDLLVLSAGRTSSDLGLDEQSAVQVLLLRAVRAWIELGTVKSPVNDPMQRVRLLLRHVDPTRRDSIEDLARQAQMSPTAFRSTFRAVTGMSPHRWLEKWRIHLAARRLLHTNLPITVVAKEMGYNDPYHFSLVFKRVMGNAPAQYRRTMRRGHEP
ncbi:MAG TPA: AraC family transcriptional regulator [Phycisphaeraceae bacterium]